MAGYDIAPELLALLVLVVPYVCGLFATDGLAPGRAGEQQQQQPRSALVV
jgi:hypothetical protein